MRTGKHVGTFRKLNPSDWVEECVVACFNMLKDKLLNCVVLAHPDFSKPLILSIDASLYGLGAVLSQVPAGEEIARPIAFASKTLSASQKKVSCAQAWVFGFEVERVQKVQPLAQRTHFYSLD